MRALLVVLISACGIEPGFPLGFDVGPWPEAQALIEARVTAINAAVGCQAIVLGTGVGLRWVPWPELGRQAVTAWVGQEIRVATTELPAELSTTGLLSACEADHVFIWWVAIRSGLRAQYVDTSKVTYGHPNCPGYIEDLTAALVAEWAAADIHPCR